jgi:hypothetical protein
MPFHYHICYTILKINYIIDILSFAVKYEMMQEGAAKRLQW